MNIVQQEAGLGSLISGSDQDYLSKQKATES